MMLYKKAFTLVETLVVMAIISMMVGLLAPKGEKFLNNIKKILSKHEKTNKLQKIKLDEFLQDKNSPENPLFKITIVHE